MIGRPVVDVSAPGVSRTCIAVSIGTFIAFSHWSDIIGLASSILPWVRRMKVHWVLHLATRNFTETGLWTVRNQVVREEAVKHRLFLRMKAIFCATVSLLNLPQWINQFLPRHMEHLGMSLFDSIPFVWTLTPPLAFPLLCSTPAQVAKLELFLISLLVESLLLLFRLPLMSSSIGV